MKAKYWHDPTLQTVVSTHTWRCCFSSPFISPIIRLLLAFHYLKPIKFFYQFPLNDAVVNHLGTKVFNIDWLPRNIASFMRRRKKRTFWRKRKACPFLCVLMRCFNQEFAAFSNMDKVRWIIHQKECKIAFYCSYLNCLQLGRTVECVCIARKCKQRDRLFQS